MQIEMTITWDHENKLEPFMGVNKEWDQPLNKKILARRQTFLSILRELAVSYFCFLLYSRGPWPPTYNKKVGKYSLLLV